MPFKSLKVRLYPTPEHIPILNGYFGACRFVYNWFLNYKKNLYETEKKSISWVQMDKMYYNQLRNEFPFLKDYSCSPQTEEIKRLDKAYNNFFKRKMGYPKFKSKFDKNSLHFAISKQLKPIKNGKLFLSKKLRDIEFRTSKEYRQILESDTRIKSISVSQTVTNKYFACFLIETEDTKIENDNVNTAVGIDLGIKTYATLSNGDTIENPKWIRTNQKRLTRLQRGLSRKQKGSNNRNKARLKYARLHEKLRNQKEHFLHNLSNCIIEKNNIILLEDLNVNGMLKNHKLAKSVQELGLNQFKTLMERKASLKNRKLLFVDRFFPSSKKCSSCGNVKEKLSLKEREYKCECCGNIMDRDLNAAINIKNEGLKQLVKL